MEKDVLNRVPKDGDLAVKSAPDCSGAHVTVGIIYGKSFWFLKNGLKHCRAMNYCIIANPTGAELEAKEHLEEAYSLRSNSKQKK